MSNEGNGAAIPWYQSPRIRQALLAFLPAVLLFIKAQFHVDLTGSVDTIINLILMLLSVVGGVMAIIRRVQDGRNPQMPNAPIKTPAVVETLSRLTK